MGNTPPSAISHQQFIRLFLGAERELLRYVMAIVPDPHEARDVVQEAAVALWERIGEYDPARPFVPWACRFAMNAALHALRAGRSRQRLLDGYAADLLAARRAALAPELDRRREHLRACLARLSAGQREVVRAYYFEDEPVERLAGRQGRSAEAIYKTLQRVRRALLECIDEKERLTPARS